MLNLISFVSWCSIKSFISGCLFFLVLLAELMLLGFISLLLTATSSLISNICIPSKFYDSSFAPCSRSEIDEQIENNSSKGRKLLGVSVLPHSFRRLLNGLNQNTCKEARVFLLYSLC